jgi:hypothetical protein
MAGSSEQPETGCYVAIRADQHDAAATVGGYPQHEDLGYEVCDLTPECVLDREDRGSLIRSSRLPA